MEEIPVVTCFLKNCGDILLLYRDEDLSSYPNKWSGISGYIEFDKNDRSREKPEKTAWREIREETGLTSEGIKLVNKGEPFFVEDSSLGKRWRIYPFLFNSDGRNIDINWESEKAEWVQPTEIIYRQTVPGLWRSYREISPTIEDIVEDSNHGSSYILARSIELIRDRAAEIIGQKDTDSVDELKNLSEQIIDSYPSMAALSNRIKNIVDERSVRQIEENAERSLKEVLKANKEAGETAEKIVSGKKVLTISRSETVRRTLEGNTARKVYISESKPGKEGIELGNILSAEIIYDSKIPKIASEVDLVLIGADSLLLNGDVINKIGSLSAGLAAKHEDIPFYVVASTDKIKKENIKKKEKSEIFEIIPSDLVTKIITEKGVFNPDELESSI